MKLPVTIKDQTIEVDIPEEKLIAAGWKKPVSKGRWKPERGERYWFINRDQFYVYPFNNDVTDKAIMRSSVIYKTQEEVEKALERQIAIIRVNDRIDELNEGWEPEWSRDTLQIKFYIESDSYGNFGASWDKSSTRPMVLNYCKSDEVAEQIIEECEADLKVIFEV